MLDANIEDFLEQTVLEYLQEGESFTSLDIANQAKDQGHRIRNYEVADWLRHNVIVLAHANSHPYNQTLIRVDSKAVGMTLAYLYHHYLTDTDAYLDRDQNPKSFQAQQPAVQASNRFDPSSVSPFTTMLAAAGIAAGTPGAGSLFDVDQYFTTRQEARDYARNNATTYRFVDNGVGAGNNRWACSPR